jgi:chromate transporter
VLSLLLLLRWAARLRHAVVLGSVDKPVMGIWCAQTLRSRRPTVRMTSCLSVWPYRSFPPGSDSAGTASSSTRSVLLRRCSGDLRRRLAALSYVAQHTGNVHGWLPPGEMVRGLALAETTPRPLIMVVQFVAFVGANQAPGDLNPWIAATLAALLTSWITSVPCLLSVLIGAPSVERVRRDRALTAALTGIGLPSWVSSPTLPSTSPPTPCLFLVEPDPARSAGRHPVSGQARFNCCTGPPRFAVSARGPRKSAGRRAAIAAEVGPAAFRALRGWAEGPAQCSERGC